MKQKKRHLANAQQMQKNEDSLLIDPIERDIGAVLCTLLPIAFVVFCYLCMVA